MKLYDELIARGLIAQATDEPEIRDLIDNGKAVFYIGFDPTADSLTAGHYMALAMMKRLQLAGNKPIALLGGGTGMVGDPSGRQDLRSMMTVETIDQNCERFRRQISHFIDFSNDRAIIANNADWLRALNYVEFLREIGTHFSVNRMLTAECYKNRMEKGLTFLEFNYMIMQGYDFYELHNRYGCNMQVGGDDQWSNMLAGTELIRRKLSRDAYALTITLLTDSNGVKMGKTAGNAVWLDANKTSPFEFFQYWRNVGDADVIKCLKMLTFLPLEQITEMQSWTDKKINEAKEILAYEMTEIVHGTDAAKESLETARSLFVSGGSADAPTAVISPADLSGDTADIITLLVKSGLCTSRSDARRAVEQGGVEADGEKITDILRSFGSSQLLEGVLIRRGKKNYKKVILEG